MAATHQNKLIGFFRSDPLNYFLVFLPFAVLAELLHWGEMAVFLLSAAAVIPMAHYIGKSTEALAEHTGPRLGGLLNATLGNAAELIITIVAIRAGLLELVKASITGSILGNVLLVMGMSMFLGGLRHGIQTFDRRQASSNAILLVLAVMALLIPSLFSGAIGEEGSLEVEALSLGVAAVMIVLYILGLIYTLRGHNGPLSVQVPPPSAAPAGHGESQKAQHASKWTLRTALVVLGLSTVAVAYLSELLVGTIEPVAISLGLSEFFLGLILIPLIGNVAEHLVAVKVALQNQMDLSVEIATASSLQIALFVAPFLVFVSLLIGHPLTLIFTTFELLALIAGVIITALVSQDGESNWLEGAELLAIYLILALAAFLL
jgi:Ca2+:H+ antiporter